ncbi:restriction endonuclease subunit S [Brevundimonas sp. R86498]|uniref:restriction endonuclease subunit S n=1 Tax=Brevundimonas sp. R86498 TaxID=3093845 RepID=UPI0037C753C0
MSSDVPVGWTQTTLGTLADITRGISWRDENETSEITVGALPVLGIRNVQQSLKLDETVWLKGLSQKAVASSTVRFGDILMVGSNGNPARIGNAVRINVPGVYLYASLLFGIRPDEAQVDAEFLFHMIRSSAVQQAISDTVQGSTGLANLKITVLRDIALSLPPLDEQRRIAAVLRSADEAVSALEASVRAARSLRQATLDDVMRSEASSTEDWPLEAVADVRTGLAKNAGRQGEKVSLPYLRVANVQDGWIDLTEVKSVDVDPAAVSRYSLRAGDVLLTEGGDYDKLGRGGVWTGEIEPCLHQNHVFAVRPDGKRLSSAFLALLTQSYLGRAYFLSCAKRTTNLASINSSQLKRLPVPALSLPRQQEIVSEIGSLDRFIGIERERGVYMRRLREALSHDLLLGRVRMSA